MFFFLSLAFTTSAYVLHRRTREDNPDEHDVWAFNETKTIESLGVTNDGILSVSLRGRSLCFSWVCGLCGLVVLWLWLWLSKKPKKEGSVTDCFLPFTSSFYFFHQDQNDMPTSGLTCSVLHLDKRDVFGKVTPHYKLVKTTYSDLLVTQSKI